MVEIHKGSREDGARDFTGSDEAGGYVSGDMAAEWAGDNEWDDRTAGKPRDSAGRPHGGVIARRPKRRPAGAPTARLVSAPGPFFAPRLAR
jgi:hypothetical protein